MSSEYRPKDFFAKQIRSSQLIASGGIINPDIAGDWDEQFDNLRLMIYPSDVLEVESPIPGSPVEYIDGAFEGIVPPKLLDDSDGTGLKVGDDVWLFISGAQNTHGTNHDGVAGIDESRVNGGVVLFGGDVVVSGTLYAEKQVVEVDLSQEGELFVSGNMKVQDRVADTNFIQFMMPVTGDYPEESGDDGTLTIFNVDSTNGRIGVLNTSPNASLDLRSGYGAGNIPTAHTNHQVEDKDGVLQDVQLWIEGSGFQTPGESIFWHLTNKEEPLSWSHASAASAPEVFRIIGLKEDVTNYDTNDIEPKVLTITDDGYVRFKEGGLGGAKLKEDRDGREEIGDEDTNESTEDANGNDIWGDDYDPANPAQTVAGNPYDNGYFVDRWHGDTLVGHALDDVNQALKTIDENNPWLWPDTDEIEGGDTVTLRDATNLVGIGTDNPVQKLHVHSGEGLNTVIRIESSEADSDGNVINPDTHSKIEFAIGNTTHSSIRQQVRPGLTASGGTDLLLQNHSISGGHYFTTNHITGDDQYALAPFVIDSNRNLDGSQLQVLILSGTTGEDANGLNPRLFSDTNFFVSGSIGSCVNPTDTDGNSIQPGNGRRGTAVFGGDVYVSGTIFGANGVVGGGGGWMTAMNGVCIDIFSEGAFGTDSETRAFDIQPFLTELIDNTLVPDNSDDDFSSFNVKLFSEIGGIGYNGTVITINLTTNTSSLAPIENVIWDGVSADKTLTIDIPRQWVNSDGDYVVPNLKDIIDCINGDFSGGPTRDWPIRAEVVGSWNSTNVSLVDIRTEDNLHFTPPGPTSWIWTLSGGGHSMRYVSWGADATSGNSPAQGQAANSGNGDTFTVQDWAQGLLIPFDCNIVGYSVRYMSELPFRINNPNNGIQPSGNEEVIWEIGTLNAGTSPETDPDPAAKLKQFFPFESVQWIKWTASDDGTYPLKWIGEGSDGDETHDSQMNIPVTAGQTLAVRVLEKDCEVYTDYKAEASVTLWLAGGGSVSLGGGSTLNQGAGGQGQGSPIDNDQVRSTTVIDPANNNDGTQVNPYGETEYRILPDLTALVNYISLTYVSGQNMLIELPDAGLSQGYSFIIKDSVGLASESNSNIRIAPKPGQTLDQYRNWEASGGTGNLQVGIDTLGNAAEPLKIEQNFASITVWSDGIRWLIS